MKKLIATLCFILASGLMFSQNPASFSKVTTPDLYMPEGSTATPLHLKNIGGHLYWGPTMLDEGGDSLLWSLTPSGVMIPKDSNQVAMPFGAYIGPGDGDLNGDNELDLSDVTLIYRYINNIGTLTDLQKAKADYNGNGRIEYGDLMGIRGNIALLETQSQTKMLARKNIFSIGNTIYLSNHRPPSYNDTQSSAEEHLIDIETGGSMRIPLDEKLYFGGIRTLETSGGLPTNSDTTVSMYRSGLHELTIDGSIRLNGIIIPNLDTDATPDSCLTIVDGVFNRAAWPTQSESFWARIPGATNNIYPTMSNKIGFGTTNPFGFFHVYSSTSNPSVMGETNYGYAVHGSALAGRGISGEATNGIGVYGFSTIGKPCFFTGDRLMPYDSIFCMQANGFTGIGTVDPSAKLSIESPTSPLLKVKRTAAFDFVQYKRAGAGAWTNITTEAATTLGTVSGGLLDVVGDFIYVGKSDKFSTIYINLGTARSATATSTFEYSTTGSTWTTLPVTDGTINLTTHGTISFTPPVDWATTTQNGSAQYYFVRIGTLSGTFTAKPTAYLIIPSDGVNPVEMYANNGDAVPAFAITKNGTVCVNGNADVSALYKVNIQGNTYTAGYSYAAAQMLSPFYQSYTIAVAKTNYMGFINMANGAATALAPEQNSTSNQFQGYAWNGSANKTNYMNEYLDIQATNPVTHRLAWENGMLNEVVVDEELMNLTSDGTLNVLGRTLGPEVLNNAAITGSTYWTAAGDYAYSTDDYTFTRATGAGNISQLSSNFLTPLKPNTWYKFTYTIGVAGPTGTLSWIGTEIATKPVYFQQTVIEIPVFFKTNSSPGNFVFYTTASTTSGMRIDAMSLNEVTGGVVSTPGGNSTAWNLAQDSTKNPFMYSGGNTIQRNIGNVGIGITNPAALLDVAGSVNVKDNISQAAIPSFDHSTSGRIVSLTAAAASTIGDVIFINSSGNAQFCKADTISNCRYALAICADYSIAANASGNWLTNGSIKDDTWSWSVGGLIYVSTSGYSGATLTQSVPAGPNNVIMPVGVALSSSVMYFFGNINSVEHQ